MHVTLHDKRIVMQVTLHYEAIVMQVTLHDKRIVMQVTLHYKAIVMEQMLLAMKDEARGTLNEEENDFMLDNAYGDETLE
nr:hypothetical protein [Tanacetum cinerariifolium]